MHFLEKAKLPDHALKYPSQLFGGPRQCVTIARSQCMIPRIMLFDEPTSALDREMNKEVLFTLSFVPQFTSADYGSVWMQILLLGLIICVIMILIDLPIVLASGRFSETIAQNARAGKLVEKTAGVLLIRLAAYVAFANRPI